MCTYQCRLTLLLFSSPLQLKEQHKEHSEQRLAIEELERNIRIAEDQCPGITDRMVKHIIDRWEGLFCSFTLRACICASNECNLCFFFLFFPPSDLQKSLSRSEAGRSVRRETVSPGGDLAGWLQRRFAVRCLLNTHTHTYTQRCAHTTNVIYTLYDVLTAARWRCGFGLEEVLKTPSWDQIYGFHFLFWSGEIKLS